MLPPFARPLGIEMGNVIEELILLEDPATVIWSAASAGFVLYHGITGEACWEREKY